MRWVVVVAVLLLIAGIGWSAGDEAGRDLSVAVLYGQGSSGGDAAFGMELIGGRGADWDGVALWLSGKPFQGEDVIDTSIPHGDYRVREEHGSIGLQYLHGSGTPRALAIVGVGFIMDETRYIQVSNVTGWEWAGGSDTHYEVTAQVGGRLQLAPGLSLRAGYDSHYRAFGGLAFQSR